MPLQNTGYFEGKICCLQAEESSVRKGPTSSVFLVKSPLQQFFGLLLRPKAPPPPSGLRHRQHLLTQLGLLCCCPGSLLGLAEGDGRCLPIFSLPSPRLEVIKIRTLPNPVQHTSLKGAHAITPGYQEPSDLKKIKKKAWILCRII